MWAKDENFTSLVHEAWNTHVQGTPMYCFVKKRKAVKNALKSLHRSEYSKMGSRIQVLKENIDNVQLKL